MVITLPESHRQWLESEAVWTGSSVDRVLADLIDEVRETEEAEMKVLAAIDAPESEPMTADDWKRLRERIANR